MRASWSWSWTAAGAPTAACRSRPRSPPPSARSRSTTRPRWWSASPMRASLDRARVGITGGSYGGYMTVRSMIRRADRFRAGVAVAPVIGWDGYDSAYTERYLGDPARDADAYARASIPGTASLLVGDLLVIHGTLDENVHPRHSERLTAALAAAGRPIEILWLSGERHRTQSRARILLGTGAPWPTSVARWALPFRRRSSGGSRARRAARRRTGGRQRCWASAPARRPSPGADPRHAPAVRRPRTAGRRWRRGRERTRSGYRRRCRRSRRRPRRPRRRPRPRTMDR